MHEETLSITNYQNLSNDEKIIIGLEKEKYRSLMLIIK